MGSCFHVVKLKDCSIEVTQNISTNFIREGFK